MTIIITGLFLYASWKDFKTLEVPLWICPTIISIQFVRDVIFEHSHLYYGIIFGILLFTLFFVFTRIANIGGADCLIAGAIGYSLGIYALHAILYGMGLCFFYTLYMKLANKEKAYPLVPFLTAGYIIENLLLGGNLIW